MKSKINKLKSYFDEGGFIIIFAPIMVMLLMIFGGRSSGFGSDTQAYTSYFYHVLNQDHFSKFYQKEYLYQFLNVWLSQIFSTPQSLFTAIFSINMTLLCINSFLVTQFLEFKSKRHLFFILVLLCSLLSPFFYSAHANVIRQGTALLFIIMFYFQIINRCAYRWLILSFFLAIGFHITSIIFILPALLMRLTYKQNKLIFIVLSSLYITGLTPLFIKLISEHAHLPLYSKITEYGALVSYQRGVRPTFIIFTLCSGLFFEFIYKYVSLLGDKEKYLDFMKIYWLLAIPFLILGFGAFSDRYLLPAWYFMTFIMAVILFKISRAVRIPLIFWMGILYVITTGLFSYFFIF